MAAGATRIRFALNHMVAPQLALRDFFALAERVGVRDVEIRNDIAGEAILDGTPAPVVGSMASDAGVTILTINALQRFNNWTADRAAEARALIDYCRGCGARALILVPTNDGTGCENGVRQRELRRALAELAPMLADAGITGLVEPLGFETCSLRSKREAVAAIADFGREQVFQITHDTFHHALVDAADLNETTVKSTGLVHISGVVDPQISVARMRDAHRVLVDARDRLANLDQIRFLRASGYRGAFSFEPFAEELRRLPDPAPTIRASMEFIEAGLAASAA